MNSSSGKYKICLVSDQLAGGGAERCSALLSQFFVQNNCAVHHVLVLDKIEYDYAGEVFNLGKLKKGNFNYKDRLVRFFALYSFFKKKQFDYIIDTRVKGNQWQEWIITKFLYTAPTIVVVHSYMTELYFPKWLFLAQRIYTKSKAIVAVSNGIKEKIEEQYNYHNVQTIYNPIDLDFVVKQSEQFVPEEFNFILAVGNMHIDVKQFDKLIKVYHDSDLPNQNIKLVIIGDGVLRSSLEQLAEALKVSDKVIFKGSLANPFPYYKKAVISVLSSRNEGFPMVLVESLACETPVVAFDCLSGPNEIIQHQHNGLLVENQNTHQLMLALNEMISNNALYLQCKKNAKSSIMHLSLNQIGAAWLQLFKANYS